MGLFSKMFAKTDVNQIFDQARELLNQSPGKALKLLQKSLRQNYQEVTFSGPSHEVFRDLTLEILARKDNLAGLELPSVKVVPWETWANPMLKNLQETVRDMQEEILYCTAPIKRSHKDAVGEIQHLVWFGLNPQNLMSILGAEDMMFRKSLIVSASQVKDPDTEEIGQDLIDFAKSLGGKCWI